MGKILWLLIAVTLPSGAASHQTEVHVTMSFHDRGSCEDQRANSELWAKQMHAEDHYFFTCEEYNDLMKGWGP